MPVARAASFLQGRWKESVLSCAYSLSAFAFGLLRRVSFSFDALRVAYSVLTVLVHVCVCVCALRVAPTVVTRTVVWTSCRCCDQHVGAGN